MEHLTWDILLSLSDKNRLTEHAKKLLNLPHTAQNHCNQYSMVNFAPLYTPILDAIHPKVIVEVGSEAGNNTKYLAGLAEKYKADYYIVDIHPVYNPVLEQQPYIHYKEMRSIDFLNDFKGGEVFFLDGDHNYGTLSSELDRIHTIRQDKRVFLFIHDTLWPLGYRDLYYDISTLDGKPLAYSNTKGPVLWDEALQPDGHFAGNNNVAMAVSEGGPGNGLATAVNDFLAEHQEYRSFQVPCFYGLTIAWNDAKLTDKEREILIETEKIYTKSAPLLSTLEWNRLIHVYLQEKLFHLDYEFNEEIKKIKNSHSSEMKKLVDYFQCKLDDAKIENDTIRTDNDVLRAENDMLKETVFQETSRNDVLFSRNNDLTTQHNKLQMQIKDLYNSRCWRITSPIRFIGDLLRKLLGKG
jgi:hypothetical protein